MPLALTVPAAASAAGAGAVRDARPGAPTGLQVSGVACTNAGISIGTVTPTLSAVFPDVDSHESITGTWEWLEVPASGVWGPWTPRLPAPPQTTASANSRATTSPLSGLANAKRYAFRVKGTDPAPRSQTSPWSPWCVFTVDTVVPTATVTVVTPPAGLGEPGTFRLDSPAPDVVTFSYGWTDPPVTEVPATGAGTGRTATVTLNASRYGTNILFARAIDATGNHGPIVSVEVPVPEPSVAVAGWGLEAYLGMTEENALADLNAARADTPLTPHDLTWVADARLIGARTAGFAGSATSYASAGAPVVSTSRSYSVAAWVRTPSLPCAGRQTVASVDGAHTSAFFLTFDCATARWGMRVADADRVDAATVDAWAPAASTGPHWRHVAGVWNAAAHEVRLYLDGALVATATPSAAWLAAYGDGWDATGPFVVGRDRYGDADGGGFAGEVASMFVYDRVLRQEDLTGDPAAFEPGLLAPASVGHWEFGNGGSCYDDSIDPLWCMAPPTDAWERWLRFRQGSDVDYSQRNGALLLDGVHFAEAGDPFHGLATVEYAVTQRNVAAPGEPDQWADAPVLRTDQSYTVSLWVRPSRVTGDDMTALSQQGATGSAFTLGVREQHWTFAASGAQAVATAADTTVWTHLVGVYDAPAGQLRLYVNGELAATTAYSSAAPANGALTVGAARSGAGIGELWFGGLDDMYVYQSAMTAAQVAELHDEQD
ncbi:LamG-like jellyroll fold domain-containing protein [Phytohabitans sp. LJ34]|uniref:LamG-like jellyroll fold domain-containing protein n=1 Tax=Phytohabitans sp. LJ34 TaxID=3452217 RepID=UPI003F8B1075